MPEGNRRARVRLNREEDVAIRRKRTGFQEVPGETEADSVREAYLEMAAADPSAAAHLLSSADGATRVQMIARLQREMGNAFVQRAVAEESSSEAPAGGVQPYRGRRMRNDKMDPFEFNKHLFGPPIFRQFCREGSLWEPLHRLVRLYWHNFGNEAGIQLVGDDRAAVWALLSRRLRTGEMEIVRTNVRERGESPALLEAFWIEFRKEYPLCYRQAQRLWRASDFRLDHEFFAVHFGMVQPPYRYWAKPS